MPNWCNNRITVKHADKEMIFKLVDAYNKDELLSAFYPLDDVSWISPEVKTVFAFKELFEHASILDRASYGWGTKWDTGKTYGSPAKVNRDGHTARFSTCTAWAPPVGVFKRWVSLGFDVHVKYNELGMQLRGIWPEPLE